MICHLAVFKCTLFAYPTQPACLGSTWLYLYSALLRIQGYFLPSVLLTGSVIGNKKNISYSVQEQQGGWLLFSSLLPFSLSWLLPFWLSIRALQKRTVHSSTDGEGLFWFRVNVESAGEALLSAHPHTVHGRQGVDTEVTTLHSWCLQASWQAQEQDLRWLPGYPSTQPRGLTTASWSSLFLGLVQLSWLLCQWHPSPPLQLAQPLLCATYSGFRNA